MCILREKIKNGYPKMKIWYDFDMYIRKSKIQVEVQVFKFIKKRKSKYKEVETIGCTRNKIEKELLLNKVEEMQYIKNIKGNLKLITWILTFHLKWDR